MSRKQVTVAYFDQSIEELRNAQQKNHDELMKLVKNLSKELKDVKSENLKLRDKVAMLTKQVTNLKNTSLKTKSLAESNDQYSRRNNIIIKNIPPVDKADKETGDDCLEKVKVAISEMGVNLSDCAIDRAHRVGKRSTSPKYGEQHFVIARFTTWRERTLVYKARKDSDLVISLDITKSRQDLLNQVREKLVAKYADAEFAFTDVNCNLVIKFASGFKHFQSWEEAKELFQRHGGKTDDEDHEEESDDEEDEDDDNDNI